MATDHVTNLKLGISQEAFLKNTEEHLEILYEQNETQNNSISNVEGIANKALTIAQGKANTEKYADLSTMVSELNKLTSGDDKTFFNVGDIIYIVDTNVPDFWVTTVNSTAVTSNTVDTLINNNFGETQFGWFTISKKEDSKLNLTNMVEATSKIPQDEIVIGDDNTKKVKGSGYSITTTLDNSDSKVPTSKAVSSAIDTKINSIEKYTLPIASETTLGGVKVGENLSVDANGVLSVTINPDEIGKVKDVQVNGETVVDENGVANIDISNIAVDVEDLKAEIKPATLVNYPSNSDIQYKAIKMDKNSVVIEVLKKADNNYSAVVTQSITVGDYTYYLLDKSVTGDYYYREVGGNAVGGGSGGSGIHTYLHLIHYSTSIFDIAKLNTYTDSRKCKCAGSFMFVSESNAHIINISDLMDETGHFAPNISFQGYAMLYSYYTENDVQTVWADASPIVDLKGEFGQLVLTFPTPAGEVGDRDPSVALETVTLSDDKLTWGDTVIQLS